jgi:PadR family transcriptional regulator, regulatory protein PadR
MSGTILFTLIRLPCFGWFELLVLIALIRLGDDACGVPMSEAIEQSSGREVAIASVYITLERLQTTP